MVVSGVPTENEGQHVFEIAEISLEIREVPKVAILSPFSIKTVIRYRLDRDELCRRALSFIQSPHENWVPCWTHRSWGHWNSIPQILPFRGHSRLPFRCIWWVTILGKLCLPNAVELSSEPNSNQWSYSEHFDEVGRIFFGSKGDGPCKGER